MRGHASLAAQLWLGYVRQCRRRTKLGLGAKRKLARQSWCKAYWRQHRIEAHVDLVRKVARNVAPMFPRVPFEDLVSAGHVGLVQAADRLDPARQGDYERYAWFVVRGAIIDAHKRRAYHEEQHDSIEAAEERMGHAPQHWLRDCRPLPDEQAAASEAAQTVEILLSELPELEQKLMRAIMAGKSMSEAARECGRSPAWGRAKLAAARDRLGAGVLLR